MKKYFFIFFIFLLINFSFAEVYNTSFVGYPQEINSIFLNSTIISQFGKINFSSRYGMLLKNFIKDNINTKEVVVGGNLKKIFVGFGYQDFVLENIYSEKLFLFNFGVKFLDTFSLATNIKSYLYKYECDEYYKEDPLLKENEINVFNLDFGLSKKFLNNFYITFNFVNILKNELGNDIKYNLPQRYILGMGYNYGLTILNFEVFLKQSYVSNFIHQNVGFKLGLEQELFYSKKINIGVIFNVAKENNNSTLDLSLNIKFLNKFLLKYTFVYPFTNLLGFYGDHYLTFAYQPYTLRKIEKIQPEVTKELYIEEKPEIEEAKEYKVEISTPTIIPQEQKIFQILQPSTSPVIVEPKISIEETSIEIEKEKPKEKVQITYEYKYKFPLAHKVKEGETLISISKKYYNNEKGWKKIYEANKDKIIRGVPIVGEILIIPEP